MDTTTAVATAALSSVFPYILRAAHVISAVSAIVSVRQWVQTIEESNQQRNQNEDEGQENRDEEEKSDISGGSVASCGTTAMTIPGSASHRKFHYRFDKRDERDCWIFFHPTEEEKEPKTTSTGPSDDAKEEEDLRSPMKEEDSSLRSLRTYFPPVYDQGDLGSCTANAICAVFQFDEIMKYGIRLRKMNPSRLFLYYNERHIHHQENEDSGASLRDGMKCASKLGICLETSWKYDIRQYTQRPSEKCYEEAKEQRAIRYFALHQEAEQLQRCIDNDFAIVFGLVIFESFLRTSGDGKVPMPDTSKEKMLGGHALVITGYDPVLRVFEIRNSWGVQWGQEGYGFLDYEYVLDRRWASDFWCLQQVENDFVLPDRPPLQERKHVTILSKITNEYFG